MWPLLTDTLVSPSLVSHKTGLRGQIPIPASHPLHYLFLNNGCFLLAIVGLRIQAQHITNTLRLLASLIASRRGVLRHPNLYLLCNQSNTAQNSETKNPHTDFWFTALPIIQHRLCPAESDSPAPPR